VSGPTSKIQDLHRIARRGRVRTVRAALVATLLLAAAAYTAIDPLAAQGVLLGGIAGALGFWSMSVRLESLVVKKPEKLAVAATLWTYYRLALYAAFLYVAYRIDPKDLHALLGGIAGLLSTRFVILFLAIRDSKTGAKNPPSA
jgi:hypothetical protein